MNCATYRRQIESEPTRHSELLSKHRAHCRDCADFSRRVQSLDQRLKTALNVPIPENLEARILLRQAFQQTHPTHRRHPLWALAASILLIFSLTISGGFYYFSEQASLETDLLSVVNTSPYALNSTGPVTAAQIKEAFEPIGLHMDSPLEKVSFAGQCLVQGKVAGHMVLRIAGKPVTLIFIPNRMRLLEAQFSTPQWQGRLVPVASGTVAIIAAPELALEDLSDRIQRLVHWNASA